MSVGPEFCGGWMTRGSGLVVSVTITLIICGTAMFLGSLWGVSSLHADPMHSDSLRMLVGLVGGVVGMLGGFGLIALGIWSVNQPRGPV